MGDLGVHPDNDRSDYPRLDPGLQVNLVWSASTGVAREPTDPIPAEISSLMREVATTGKLVE